jgi:hypothetical protein
MIKTETDLAATSSRRPERGIYPAGTSVPRKRMGECPSLLCHPKHLQTEVHVPLERIRARPLRRVPEADRAVLRGGGQPVAVR